MGSKLIWVHLHTVMTHTTSSSSSRRRTVQQQRHTAATTKLQWQQVPSSQPSSCWSLFTHSSLASQ
jgi:hypothetical protein